MATLKLKPANPAGKSADSHGDRPSNPPNGPRAPIRGSGSGVRKRPTLAEAQAQRDQRERQYQEQLRLRYGDKPAPRPAGRRPDSNETPRYPDPRQRPENRGDQRAAKPPRSQQTEYARPAREQPAAAAKNTTRSPRAAEPFRDAHSPTRPAPNRAFGPPAARQATVAPANEVQRMQPRAASRPTSHVDDSLRLSKYMGELGIASRREADEWIEKGWVRVDGRVVSELGSRVLRGQQVTVDAKARFVQAQKVTVLINKPVGYVSGQAEDGYEPAFVLVKPNSQWTEDHSGIRFLPQHLRSLVPAGRLDIDSVGLLVLTQDGRIAKQLIGENSEIEKEYLVRVAASDSQSLSEQGLALLRHGLELDGAPLREALVEWVNEDQLRFVLREGKKRQIRRMCEAVGLQVLGLKRVRVGRIMLGDLPTGHWRYLRLDEGFV